MIILSEPLVTVNILSYNRMDELRFTLQKVFEQDYKNIEVIVVDNASTDGSGDMVETEFPEVKLIRLNKNIGVAGWNRGFEVANGEYVLVLDDDSYPEIGSISAGVKIIENNELVAVVGFTIFNAHHNLIENKEEYVKSHGQIFETSGFIGCGALIKRNVFLKLNGFDNSIFLYYNELEFAIRAKNAGYKILFLPNARVTHIYSSKLRSMKYKGTSFINSRRFEHTFKSYFLFLFYHFNLKYFLKYSLKLILSKFYIAVKLGFLREFIRVLFELPYLMKNNYKHRNPVKIEVQKEYNYGNLKFKDLYVYY